MTALSGLLQEALDPGTPAARLAQLAAHSSSAVRRTAREHKSFPTELAQVMDIAERTPQLLTPEQLDLLGVLGPYTAALAAQHPATTDETVTKLILNGHIKQLLDYRPSRGETWILARAQENPGLCEYLKTSASVPLRIRKAAAKLPPVPSSPAAAESPTAPAENNATITEAAAPQTTATETQEAATVDGAEVARPLRERLLDRRTDPQITADERTEIQATRRLWSLAARHPLLPLDLLQWLDEQRPYGEARETLLRRLEGPLEESLLLDFAWKGSWEERAAVARNPALPQGARLGLTVDPDWWVRSAAAENPNAEPGELAALAQDPDHVTIREHVASHPHASGPTLLALAADGDHTVRLQVARNPSSPPEALSLLAGDTRYAIREAVAAHPYTPADVLDALAQDVNERVQFVANLRRAPLGLAQAQQALDTRRRNAKLAVAAQEAPAEMLVRLSRDRNPRVRAQVGLNPHTPSAARALLLTDQAPEVQRVAQAASPNTPGQELSALPRFDARVREGLSSNVSAPDDLLVALSDDPLRDIRLNVLLNPAAPGGALERRLPEQPMRPVIRLHPRYGQVQTKLHDLEWDEVRQPDVSAEALAALGQSDALRVRCRVAAHPLTPQETLEVLVNDPEEEVRSGIVSRGGDLAPGLQAVLAQDASVQLRKALLRRKDVDPSVLSIVLKASLNDEDILLSLVRHSRATPELLAELAEVTSAEIREAVARDPRTLPSTLEKLSMDSQAAVQRGILRNPACTPALLRRLANHRHLRLEVAHHSGTDGGTLEHLAYDAGYARFLQLERWTRRLPFSEHVLFKRWRRWSKQRASARALSDVLILSAVIAHPAATPRAVRMASRLDHPNIEKARQDRQHAVRQEAQHG